MIRIKSVVLASLLILGLAGCSSAIPMVPADETSSMPAPNETAVAAPAVERSEVIVAAERACLFDPAEITAAYSSWSEYVAGPGIPDESDGSCGYPHLDPALQYVSTPFTIWVTGYDYLDKYFAFRMGLLDYTAADNSTQSEVDLDRAFLWNLYCPSGTATLDVVSCEETENASIVVFDSYRALIMRDDVVWELEASGSTAGDDVPQEDASLLAIARIAADRD